MPTTLNALRYTQKGMYFQSIYPVNGYYDDNANMFIPFTNVYDTDGFISQVRLGIIIGVLILK